MFFTLAFYMMAWLAISDFFLFYRVFYRKESSLKYHLFDVLALMCVVVCLALSPLPLMWAESIPWWKITPWWVNSIIGVWCFTTLVRFVVQVFYWIPSNTLNRS
jgi:hypothetical protein